MKGQIIIEFMVVFVSFALIIHLFAVSQAHKNQIFEEKTSDLKELIKSEKAGTYCNLIYLKGKSVVQKYKQETNVNQSRINCFSDDYNFNQMNPRVKGVRLWF